MNQLIARARLPIEAAVETLERAIAAENMLVLHRLDPQRILAAHGYAIAPARQILFFHPRYMARLLAIDPPAVVEAPLKIALFDGVARMADPRVTFGAYPGIRELGDELSAASARILAALDIQPIDSSRNEGNARR